MLETGFHVYWCILDGADVNGHLKGEDEAMEKRFTAQNLYTGEPFVFVMDSKVNNLKNEMKLFNLTSLQLNPYFMYLENTLHFVVNYINKNYKHLSEQKHQLPESSGRDWTGSRERLGSMNY